MTPPDGSREPLAPWLRVWGWSLILPVPLLDGLGPLLAAVCRARSESLNASYA
ncbi:hypothetical protein GCM10010372_62970 [Streptomyces tauricus]|nr:hypothetical protein GCM10010372_62970 [Streptomyces tauricus]